MTNLVRIIVGLFVAGALGGAAYVAMPQAKNSPNPIVPVAQASGMYLFRESGDVYFKESTSAEYQSMLENQMPIENGTYVKTGTGLAHVVFPDNSMMSISENTEIEITFTGNKTTIIQSIGDTYHRVQKLQAGAEYEVRTPGTLAAVRGTKFAVSYNPKVKKTKVSVTEHVVIVTRFGENQPTGTSTPIAPEKPVSVTLGMTATVDTAKPETPVGVQQTKNDPTIKQWLDRNDLLDKYIDLTPVRKDFLVQLVTDNTADVKTRDGIAPASSLQNLQLRLDATKLRIQKPSIVVPPTVKTLKPVLTKPVTTKPPTVVVPPKVIPPPTNSEEDPFVATFDPLYARLFQLDANDSICQVINNIDAKAMVQQLVDVTLQYDREITNAQALINFATDLQTYCRHPGDAKVRAALQARFNTEDPFSGN